jgi:hypothetical protein
MFILAMCAAHLTGTLNGIALGLYIGDRLARRR